MLVLVFALVVVVIFNDLFQRHDLKSAFGVVGFLPTAALVLRAGTYAARSGDIVPLVYWPFASGRVAFIWIIVTSVLMAKYGLTT